MRTRSQAKRERERERTAPVEETWRIEVPNDPINEQVLLSAMMLDTDVRERLVKKIRPEHFFAERHRTQSNFRIETTINLRSAELPNSSHVYD